MSELSPARQDMIKLAQFPPNRGIMDWHRVLFIGQIGKIVELHANEKTGQVLYHVWFSSENRQEGWEVWLAREHFTPINKDGNRGY